MLKDTLLVPEGKTRDEAYDNIVDQIDKDQVTSMGGSFFYNNTFGNGNNYSTWNNNNITGLENTLTDMVIVNYVNWTSLKLIKKIEFTNELGEIEVTEVADDYVVQSEYGEKLLDEYWVSEKWEGYMVGDHKFFFGIQ